MGEQQQLRGRRVRGDTKAQVEIRMHLSAAEREPTRLSHPSHPPRHWTPHPRCSPLPCSARSHPLAHTTMTSHTHTPARLDGVLSRYYLPTIDALTEGDGPPVSMQQQQQQQEEQEEARQSSPSQARVVFHAIPSATASSSYLPSPFHPSHAFPHPLALCPLCASALLQRCAACGMWTATALAGCAAASHTSARRTAMAPSCQRRGGRSCDSTVTGGGQRRRRRGG